MKIGIGDRLWFFCNGTLTEAIVKSIGRSYARFDRSKHRLNLETDKIEVRMVGGWWGSCRYFVSPEDASYWMEGRLWTSKILVERVGYYNGQPHTYPATVPAPTIRASQHIDGYQGSYRVAYNIVDDFDCFAADIRCLAAWQGFQNYNWGLNKGEAGRAIGNAVPPALSAAVTRSFGQIISYR